MRLFPTSPVPRAEKRRRVPLAGRDGLVLAVFATGLAIGIRLLQRERQADQREIEAHAEVQRSAKARASMLGMVSHELRTPLQALLTNAELLTTLTCDDQVLDVSRRMIRMLEQMSGQLDNIARYAKLTSGTEVIRREATRLPELLKSIAAAHVEEAIRGQQSIELKFGEGTDLTISTDPIRLLQVVDNYVVNALKYAGPGVITLSCTFVQANAVGPRACAESIEICVTDRGPGISDGEKDQIWEPFFRGGRGTRKKKGTGLGLAVVKLLASSVGWPFGTRSGPGGGTTFFVRVPVR